MKLPSIVFRKTLVACVAVALVIGGVGFWLIQQRTQADGEGGLVQLRPGPIPWMGPIPGVQTSLSTAESAAAFPAVPLLPSSTVSDPCTGESSQIELLETWVNTEAEGKSKQLGFVYADGIWMNATSLDQFDSGVTQKGELAPLDAVFSEADRPSELKDGVVRGHPAWVKELSPDFACDHTIAVSGDGSASMETDAPSSIGPMDPTDHRIFDVTETASLRWVEGDVMIHLVGPFTVDELTGVAKSLTWA